MATVGLAVITYNEEDKIERCITSVPFAEDCIIVDSESTDRTVEIAKNCGAQVIIRPWPGYPAQKQFALEQIKSDWILILDADEYLSPEVQNEIIELVNGDPEFYAYQITGQNYFLGKTLKHGKGLDTSIRLVRRGKVRWDRREVHESIVVDDDLVSRLNNPLIHVSAPTIKDKLFKAINYSEIELKYYVPNSITKRMIFIHPVRYFFSYLIRRSSWKDGLPGIIWLLMHSFQLFYQHVLCYEQDCFRKQKNSD